MRGTFLKKINIFFLALLSVVSLFAEQPEFPPVERPAQKFFVGEKLVYSIRYFGIPIGKAEGRVEERVERDGREAYHVSVFVSSHPILDLIRKVRGEHHTWIDADHLYSLAYEAASGSKLETDLRMRFDHGNGTVEYEYPPQGAKKKMEILEGSQDQLSLGYYFRTRVLKERDTVVVPVNADEKNWRISIKTGEIKAMRIPGIGHFTALEVEPELSFVGMLAKPGRARGWISLDERRIPLQMRIRVPWIGSLVAELVEYHPGGQTPHPSLSPVRQRTDPPIFVRKGRG